MTQKIVKVSESNNVLPNPSDTDLSDPLFNAIWEVTKTWDVNAPEYYEGYCGLNGSHVMIIINAIRAILDKSPSVSGEAVAWQFFDADLKWHNGYDTNNHKKNTIDAGYKVRDLYTTPQPDIEPKDDQMYLLKVLADIRQAIGNTDKLMLDELAPFINKRITELEYDIDKWKDRAHRFSQSEYDALGKVGELQATNQKLLDAAKNVIARWDSPLWKDQPHTAISINELRQAITEAEGK